MVVKSGTMFLAFEAPGKTTGLTPTTTVRLEDGTVVATVSLTEAPGIPGVYRGQFTLIAGRYITTSDFGLAGTYSTAIDARTEVMVR